MTRKVHKFLQTLGLLNSGRFEARCDEHLANALAALDEMPDQTGIATITLTLKLTATQGEVKLTPTVVTKLPNERALSSTTFWIADGALSTEHPSQMSLDFPRAARGRDVIDGGANG